MKNVQKLSRIMRVIFQMCLVIIPMITCYIWLVSGTKYDFISTPGVFAFSIDPSPYTTLPLSYDTRVFSCIVALLKDGIYLYALTVLIHLFRNYEKCEIFSLDNVTCYQKLSYSVFYWIVGSSVFGALDSVILSFHNPKGKHFLDFGFDDTQVTALALGFVVLIISHVMKEGYVLADENRHII